MKLNITRFLLNIGIADLANAFAFFFVMPLTEQRLCTRRNGCRTKRCYRSGARREKVKIGMFLSEKK